MLKQVGEYEEGLKLDRRTATTDGYNNSKNYVHKMNSQSIVKKAQKNKFLLL